MRKLRIAVLIFAAFDFFFGGTMGGFLALTPIVAAQNSPKYPFVSGAPDCIFVPPAPFTAVADSTVYDNRNQGCTTWHLVYNAQGFSALNISFKSADDSGNGPGVFTNWGTSGGTLASGTALPLTAITSGQATGYKYRPFVKISVTSVTGSGTIWPMLYGYRPGASVDSSSTGANNVQGVLPGGVSGASVLPVVVAGCVTVTSSVCAGNISPFLVDASTGRLIVQGAGSSNGLAQAMAVFSLPNSISASVPTTVALNTGVTTAINLKATSGTLYALEIQNPNASLCFLQVFDVAQGSVTLGTTAPKFSVPLLTSGEKFVSNIPFGLLFSSTALSMAATTTSNGLTTCASGLVVSSWVQ